METCTETMNPSALSPYGIYLTTRSDVHTSELQLGVDAAQRSRNSGDECLTDRNLETGDSVVNDSSRPKVPVGIRSKRHGRCASERVVQNGDKLPFKEVSGAATHEPDS